MDMNVLKRLRESVAPENREAFDRALKAFSEFATTTVPYSTTSIANLSESVREGFVEAGIYDLHQADIELSLHDVVVRAHKISGQSELSSFATTEVPYDTGSINHIADTIREHAALAFMDDGFKRALERSIEEAKTRAHLITSAKEFERFRNTDVPYGASSIDHIGNKIIEHGRLGGLSEQSLASLSAQVDKAKIRAHEVSGRKAIGQMREGNVMSVEYVDMLARDAREHFKAAGIKVKPAGAPSLGIMPAARLGREIDDAAQMARQRIQQKNTPGA